MLKEGLALADRDDAFIGHEGEELAEPPDATEIHRLMTASPRGLEFRQFSGNLHSLPFLIHVKERSAPSATGENLACVVRRGTVRGEASLEGSRVEAHGMGGP